MTTYILVQHFWGLVSMWTYYNYEMSFQHYNNLSILSAKVLYELENNNNCKIICKYGSENGIEKCNDIIIKEGYIVN